MHIYSRLIVVFIAAPLLNGCVSTRQPPMINAGIECVVGGDCEAVGRLFIYHGVPASVAELKTVEGCFALALKDDQYRNLKKFQGESFRIRGKAYAQVHAEGVASYQLNDRWVATGICSVAPIIYVTEIVKT